MITAKAVEEYCQIYKKVFREDITYQEAEAQGMRLLEMFKVIYRPLKVKDDRKGVKKDE